MADIEKSSSEKKLSVIMFTDIAGYSRMMNRNEDQALEFLLEHNDIIKDLIKENSGIIIKTIGDSFLVKFDSTSNCLKCAVEIQKKLALRNRSRKKNEVVLVKIGIHIGDVLLSEDDVFGDTVNIASRIESKAEGGEIYISDSVYNVLGKNSSFQFQYLGEFKLKNIENPAKIYEVLWLGKRKWSKHIFKKRWFRAASVLAIILLIIGILVFSLYRDLLKEQPKSGLYDNRLSLAVMGFHDGTRDSYLKDIGIENILTDALNQKFYEFPEIHLISPISIAIIAKKKNLNSSSLVTDLALTEEIARNVKANLLVAGRLYRLGKKYILTSSLHSIDENRLVGKFEIEFNQINEILTYAVDQLFKKITKSLINNYKLKSGGEVIPVSDLTTSSLEAYSKFIKGYNLTSSGVFHPGIDMMIEATKIDPNFAVAYSMIACKYFDVGDHEKGLAYHKKAKSFKDRFAKSISKEGLIYKGNIAWYDFKLWEVKYNYSLIMELYPDDPEGYAYYAGYLRHLLKSPQKAVKYFERAIELKPDYFPYYRSLALTFSDIYSVDRGVKVLQEYISENPKNASVQYARETIARMRERK